YLGVIGVFKNSDRSLHLHYDLVRLDDEFETAKDQAAANPVVKLLEGYSKEVRDKDLLGRFPQVAHPMQVTFQNERFHPAFVGSERCKGCHQSEFEVWDTSKHGDAFKALEESKKPSFRQYDGECIQCHTVGFGYHTGYRDEQRTPHLKNVGCE